MSSGVAGNTIEQPSKQVLDPHSPAGSNPRRVRSPGGGGHPHPPSRCVCGCERACAGETPPRARGEVGEAWVWGDGSQAVCADGDGVAAYEGGEAGVEWAELCPGLGDGSPDGEEELAQGGGGAHAAGVSAAGAGWPATSQMCAGMRATAWYRLRWSMVRVAAHLV